MWPPSIVASRYLIDEVEIFSVKLMLLCCVFILLIKLCRASNL